MRTILPLLLLPACVLDVGRGPDLGACASYPEGAYTFGEVGIGTCLAGPADARFFTWGGTTWLAVANADPFHNFTSGSLLLIDTLSINRGLAEQSMDELTASALPMESFIGQLAFDPGRLSRALVPSRLSPDSFSTDEPDKVWLVDLSDPSAPRYEEPRSFLTVRQDPFTVAASGDKAYVLSPTDHSISVIDLGASPPELYDPAPESRVGDITFDDADGSGSRTELVATPLPASEIPTSETWTATWIEGTTRLWVPLGDSLVRYTWGGDRTQPPALGGLGVELTPEPQIAVSAVRDAFFVDNGESLSLHVPTGNAVYAAYWNAEFAVWQWDGVAELRTSVPWAAQIGGPTLSAVGPRTLMYFDGQAEDDLGPSIGVATTTDGVRFSALDEPVVAAGDAWSALAQPTVIADPFSGSARMWMSAWDGARWVITTSESPEGLQDFTAPTQVLAVDGEDVGAPHVSWVAGAFQMWVTVSQRTDEGGAWWYATSESADGLEWSTPELRLQGPAITNAEDRPPRAAIQLVPTAAWRVEGSDSGPLDDLVFEAFPENDPATGSSLRFASGADLGADVAGLLSEGGVEPGSWALVDGLPTLYATVVGADGRQRLAMLRQLGSGWGTRAVDLIPEGEGGNVLGVRSPAVFATPDGWWMLYAAWGADGAWSIRQASSTDGVSWTPAGAVLPDPPTWASGDALPHTVEADGDGWRAWFSGSDGSRSRIGTLVGAASADGITWTLEGVALEPGEPGTFDDKGVTDPTPTRCGGIDGLWYTADDGERFSIAYAARTEDGTYVRRARPYDDALAAVLGPTVASFAGGGVRSPVLGPVDGERCTVYISGFDGARWRTGTTVTRGEVLYPAWARPTQGDVLNFSTFRGEPGTSTIDLGQVIGGVPLPGWDGLLGNDGPSATALDAARGWLFVVSKGDPRVIVVDIRDDSTATQADTNYLDIEAVLRFPTPTGTLGFYDVVLGPDQRIYLAAREPESVMVVDTSSLVDDAVKELVDNLPQGLVPMHDLNDDAGESSFAPIGTAGLALVPGQGLLLATHFRDNALSVIDLSAGPWGEEIRYLQDIGENPHLVRVSPDGTYAVIANYLGAVTQNATGSSLSILDLQPASSTWLEITTRIVNQ
jgi:hypothetical protein